MISNDRLFCPSCHSPSVDCVSEGVYSDDYVCHDCGAAWIVPWDPGVREDGTWT
jgi:ribosomal protein L37AE/L43A